MYPIVQSESYYSVQLCNAVISVTLKLSGFTLELNYFAQTPNARMLP
jgi:hypothetical protein